MAPLRLADLPGGWRLDADGFEPVFGECPQLPGVAEEVDQVVYADDRHWVFQVVGRADDPERRMDEAAEHAQECRPEPEGETSADVRPLELPPRGDRTVGVHYEGTSDGSRFAVDIAYVQLADVVSAVGVVSSPDRPADRPPVELLDDLVERALRRMTVEAP